MPPRPATRLAPGERREHLLRTGVELLGRRPYDQVSIGDIAAAAGISKGLLYHYFATKSDFVVAVLQEGQQVLSELMNVDPSLPPREQVVAAIDAWLAYTEEHAPGFLAVTRARTGPDPKIVAVLGEQRRHLTATLEHAAAALNGHTLDQVRGPRLSVGLEGWLALTEAVVVRWLTGWELTRREVGELLVQALVGVGRVAAGPVAVPAG